MAMRYRSHSGSEFANYWNMSVTEPMDRRPTRIRSKGEPSKGRINLRLETTWAKTSKARARDLGDTAPRRALPSRRHITGLCAATEESCWVLYSQRGTALRRALLPWVLYSQRGTALRRALLPERPRTAPCSTARETPECAALRATGKHPGKHDRTGPLFP